MVIPFETLRYQAGKDRIWGLQILRNFRRRNEQSFWSPITRAFEISQLDAEGELEGLDLTLHHNLEILPYVLGGFDSDYTRAGDATVAALAVGHLAEVAGRLASPDVGGQPIRQVGTSHLNSQVEDGDV